MTRLSNALVVAILLTSGCASDTHSLGSADSLSLIQARLEENRRAERPVQALFQLETLVSHTGWTPELRATAAELRRSVGDTPGAAAMQDELSLTSAAVLADQARVELELGQWNDALMSLRELIAITPNDTWAQFHYGVLLAIGGSDDALPALTTAQVDGAYRETAAALVRLFSNPDAAVRLMAMGAELVQRGDWSYAELAFTQAAVISLPYAEALASTAWARAAQGKDGTAQIGAALALEPQSGRVRYLEGLYYRTMGDGQAAVNAFAQAVALEPDNPAYYAGLAQTHRDGGDLVQAEQWFQLAVDVSGQDARYVELLALFYADETENLTRDAYEVLENAFAQLPDDVDLQAGYGWTLYASGERERGRELVEQAAEAAPDNPRVQFYLGRILLEEGETDAARTMLESVASGTSEFARSARAILQSIGTP